MRLINPEESRRISSAVEAAEANTAGEIVTAIIPESDDYAARELLFGILVGTALYVVLVFFSSPLETLLNRLIWGESTVMLPLSMMALSLLAGSAAYALAQIPAVDRLIAGRRNMAEAVRRRAMRHFVESAAYDTIDRTGVLLFVSVLERRVELIADKGIDGKVDTAVWKDIVASLVRGIRKKQTAAAIEGAVTAIGAVLAEHAPPRPDDVNEIADKPEELGKGS